MKKTAYLAASAIITTLGCGATPKESDKGKVAQETPTKSSSLGSDETSLLLEDDQLASEHVAGTVDDAITDAIEGSESQDSGGAGFALAAGDKRGEVSRFRACQVNENRAEVTIKRSVERERLLGKHGRNGSMVMKLLMEKNRIWSKEGATLTCSADGKHAEIDRADMQGVQLQATFKRSHLQSSTSANIKKGTSMTRSRKTQAEGTRTTKWTSVKSEGTSLILTKEVRTESSRSMESLNKKGEKKSFTTSLKTDPTAPLVIVIERKADSDDLISRTIVSGKKIATHKSGGRVETVFSNVKYLPSEGCYAVSGTVEGSFFAKDATQPSASFKIDFAGDSKSMVLTKSDGTTLESEYVADGCDLEGEELEETSGIPTEKSAASEVKLDI